MADKDEPKAEHVSTTHKPQGDVKLRDDGHHPDDAPNDPISQPTGREK